MKRPLMLSGLLLGLMLAAGPSLAADEEVIYGSQLMTQQERLEYRNKMRAAKTAEEQAKIRAEHHEAMKARAKAQGKTLPDEPPARGAGMGPGAGGAKGPGMGPGGGGMGPGGGGMGPGRRGY